MSKGEFILFFQMIQCFHVDFLIFCQSMQQNMIIDLNHFFTRYLWSFVSLSGQVPYKMYK